MNLKKYIKQLLVEDALLMEDCQSRRRRVKKRRVKRKKMAAPVHCITAAPQKAAE